MASAQDIFNAAQQQIVALQIADSAIDNQVSTIKDANWGNPLTAAQLAQITTLRAQQGTLLSSIQELSYVTMAALDNSDDVQKLTAALQAVVTNLNAATASITAIGVGAQNIGAIASAISALVPQLQALIPAKPAAAPGG